MHHSYFQQQHTRGKLPAAGLVTLAPAKETSGAQVGRPAPKKHPRFPLHTSVVLSYR